MEGSPLILAQTHARKASKANTPTAAIDEHDLAAGQFATAAKATNSSEAFRTLKLLEQHHEKLSQLLKFQTSHPIPQNPDGTTETREVSLAAPSPGPAPSKDSSPYRQASHSLPAAHRPQRDASSSIASNLASARGIPTSKQRRSGQVSSPAVAQQHAEGKITTPPRRSKLGETPIKTKREDSMSPEKAPVKPQAITKDAATPTSKETVPEETSKPSDDAFNRFYTTFETLLSKLSAPLAFAGLPLNEDLDAVPTAEPATSILSPTRTKPTRAQSSRRATAEPAYSQLFSPAALAAVREEPGNAALGAAESFYVVPTTGGTMPYASILARHQQHQPHHNRTLSRDSTGLSEDIDEFVDARENPGEGSPVMSRKGGRKSSGGKSMEELQLENESLRGVLDEMSRRLWQFEMGAQMGSVALHQSIRASLNRNNSGSPVASVAGAGGAEGRVAGLEEEMQKTKKEVERMGRENEKLKGVVSRYRERWEKLKEGARTRQKGGSGGGDGKDRERTPELGGEEV